MSSWFWAAVSGEPARGRFVIADGQDELWRRVRSEVDPQEGCAWDAIHRGQPEPAIKDILDLLLVVVPTYRVNHNRFVFEAAQIPVFAEFIRGGRHDLPNYVSNSTHPEPLIPVEPYNEGATRRLGAIVSDTLGTERDWF